MALASRPTTRRGPSAMRQACMSRRRPGTSPPLRSNSTRRPGSPRCKLRSCPPRRTEWPSCPKGKALACRLTGTLSIDAGERAGARRENKTQDGNEDQIMTFATAPARSVPPTSPPAGNAIGELNRRPLAPKQRYAAILIAFGEFIDGYDLLVMGAAIIFLRREFALTPQAVGLLGASTFVGAIIGLLVFGDLSDRLGRRSIFIVNLFFFV